MLALIVDDDIPTVEVIQNSIRWRDLGIDRVETAYDFVEAQNRIRAQAPDIVLCDIEMPRGSGLDLLRWLREEGMECEFVFLTCHANFDYAKIAIQYGAADYITKPFNIQATEVVLNKVVARLLYRRQLLAKSQAGGRWEDEKQLAQAAFLRSLLFDGTRRETAELQTRLDDLGIPARADGQVYLMLAAIPQSRVDSEWPPELFGYALRNLTAELMGGLDDTRVFNYIKQDTHYCLVWFDAGTPQTKTVAMCRKLCDACSAYLQCETTCYLSDPSGFAGMSALREDLEQRDISNLAHRGDVLRSADFPRLNESLSYRLDVRELERLFQQENAAGIASLIQRDLQQLAGSKQLTPTLMNQIHQDFLQVLYTVMNRNELQAHELFGDAAATRLNQNAERSVFDMTKWASFAADRAVSFIKESREAQSVTGKIEQYIRTHYMQKIGRDEIAAAVYLTPDYANRLFKEAHGVSIKDYLNLYRIEQAKHLLRQKENNISDIAGQVGLDNFSYFSTLFKKYTGCSPSEFRKNFLEEKQPWGR